MWKWLEEGTMNIGKVLALVSALFFGLLIVAPAARADEWDQLSKLTFSQPIQIPGNKVLPAGTYCFRLADSPSRHLVQIYNSNGSQLYATIPTISDQQPGVIDYRDVTNHTVLTFAEAAKGEPYTLVDWFYPDHIIGNQFVYSSPKESQMAEERILTVTARPAKSS
jgi:hypothetical protein